jgi:Flp pilus assembly protein TadD
MADQNDKSPGENYEGLFADSSSSDVIDVTEDAAGGDISDFDDDSEEGIFAPPQKREPAKSKNGVLLGAVAVIAILGGGGFFVMSNPDVVSQLKKNLGLEEAPSSQAQAEVGASSDALVSLPPRDDIPAPDAVGMEGVPQPEVIENAEISSVVDPVDQGAGEMGAPESNGVSAEGNEPSPAALEKGDGASPMDVPVEATSVDVVPVVDVPVEAPVLDVPDAGRSLNVEPDSPDVASAQLTAASPESPVVEAVQDNKVPKQPDQVELKEPSVPASVSQAVENKVEAQKTDEVVEKSVNGSSSASGMTSSEEGAKGVYFDSPPGENLKNIPAPSLDPKKGKGDSIIIVKGVSSASSDQESRVIAANRALRLGMYDSALELYNNLYKVNPRDERILMGRAVSMQKTGDVAGAIRTYEELLTISPNNPDAVVNLMGLVRKEYPAVALNKLLDLRQKYPDNAGIAAQLGIAYADSGNLQDAYRYLGMAASLDPNDPQHYFNMAVVAEKMKNPRKAIEMYEKALEVDAVHGAGRGISRDLIYDRLAKLRGN